MRPVRTWLYLHFIAIEVKPGWVGALPILILDVIYALAQHKSNSNLLFLQFQISFVELQEHSGYDINLLIVHCSSASKYRKVGSIDVHTVYVCFYLVLTSVQTNGCL